MPEQLQETGSGEILQNRYDSIDEMINDLEGVDTSIDEENLETKAEEEYLNGKSIGDLTETEKAELEEAKKEKVNERKQEIIDELTNISYNGE
jgi:hypothetical protein